MSATPPVDDQLILARVGRLGGITEPDAARRAILATLEALGASLSRGVRSHVAAALPAAHAAALMRPAAEKLSRADAFYDRARALEGTTPGFALEHVQVVCRALGTMLPDETLQRMKRDLPGELASLFNPPAREGEPPLHASRPPSHPPPHRETLAAGHPGFTHTLAESAPAAGQTHSVVREQNPHADTKLSSSRGMTQERLEEDLATGEPRGKPVSETSD